jgi:hypothetical protein
MTPLDFYDKFIWNGLHACTRCGTLFRNWEEARKHAQSQDCEPNDGIAWIEDLETE